MTDHTVRAFDRELEMLGRKIAEMGGLAEKMLSAMRFGFGGHVEERPALDADMRAQAPTGHISTTDKGK